MYMNMHSSSQIMHGDSYKQNLLLICCSMCNVHVHLYMYRYMYIHGPLITQSNDSYCTCTGTIMYRYMYIQIHNGRLQLKAQLLHCTSVVFYRAPN